MGFRRNITPRTLPQGDALTTAMVGIGMNFAVEPRRDANIEDTILAASVEGMEHDDLRVLSVLTTWLGVHLPYVNADRLVRMLTEHPSDRVRAYWSAIAKWHAKDHRLARLVKTYAGPRLDLLVVGTDFQLSRAGEDVRFTGSPLRVAANTLRDRAQDVLTPAQLAKRHSAYRCRVLMGPSYRADVWAELEKAHTLSAAELARRTYASIATAWNAKQQWTVLHEECVLADNPTSGHSDI